MHKLILIILIAPLSLFAQKKWKFQHITPENGLSDGTVHCTFKDSKGFVWIGTSNGLNRYDGYEIVVYQSNLDDPKSLSNSYINVITQISEDKVLIGTENGGLNIFDWTTGAFTRIGNDELGVRKGGIEAILPLSEKEVLLGIQDVGLCHYNFETSSSILYQHDPNSANSLSDNSVFSIAQAPSGKYWIGTHGGGVDLFDLSSKTFEHFVYDESFDIPETDRKPLLVDSNNDLWIGTDGFGLVHFDLDGKQFTTYTAQNSGLRSDIITTLFENDGLIYIGTDGQGINVLNPNSRSFTYLTSSLLDNTTLSSNAVYDIYKDDSGMIWVGTFRGGVNTHSPNRTKFELIKQIPYEKNSLSFASVIDVMESADGYIWIGTDGGGLDRLDPKTGELEHFKSDPNNVNTLSTNVAISLTEDENGLIWVGTYAGGVNLFNPRTGWTRQFLHDPNDRGSIGSKNVWDGLIDSNGDLWFALLNQGIDKYNPDTETFTHYTDSDGPEAISSNNVYDLFEDSKDNFWIGTSGGLNLFDRSKGTFQHFKSSENDPNSLVDNFVRTLTEDSRGNLLIGTMNGMSVMDLSDFSIVSSPANELLPSLAINAIQEDKQGNLWIGTSKGLSKFNPATKDIINYGIADGLQGLEFNYTSSITARDGTMYFGGTKGINYFNPNEIRKSDFQPNISITSINLYDKSISELEKNGKPVITSSIQALKAVSLDHDQDVLEINFVSLDFTSPASNLYRYKLDGFDKEWKYTSARKRSANYTNLDPGDYTFRVQGSNSDGIWSKSERSLNITIRSPWWATWWFTSLCVTIVVGAISLFVSWRARSVRLHREELNRRIDEATSQVKSQNEILRQEQEKLNDAIEETNFAVKQAVESGDFTTRINLEDKEGEWKKLGESINALFDSIVVPFNSITEIIGAMATSNLSMRYENEAKGDVLKLSSSLNYALDNLSGLLGTLVENMAEIGAASQEMLVSGQEMKVGTGEIASSTSELSRGAQEQVSRIDEASHILENILESSSNVSNQAQSINDAAEKGAMISDQGKNQMTKMDSSMESMLVTSKESNEAIDNLSDKSASISSMLNAIKEITIETNMLALNAAIEAAKAGDAGRGFAVVADQIRKLAENSNHFAIEIENIISEVQSSIGATSNLISDMGVNIDGGAQASKDASNSFDELAASYAQTLGLSNQILSHSEEQHKKIKEVVQLMESVVVISEQAAAGTEEIASSSNELSSGMNEYIESSSQVAEIIQRLNEKMQQFKLK